ncbi:hypothetical protein SDC9_128105 [bioreactor metagenome]|uniref:Uncharacterized protein n=1 Tax=bioreactor metagenome TaxID=1076179 RepID=A0A645CVZ7_9ZZZZ
MSHLTGVLNQPESLANSEAALQDYIDIIETEHTMQAGNDSHEDPLMAMREKYQEKKGYGG